MACLREKAQSMREQVEKRERILDKFNETYRRCKAIHEQDVAETTQSLTASLRSLRVGRLRKMKPAIQVIRSFAQSAEYLDPYSAHDGETEKETEQRQIQAEDRVLDALSEIVRGVVGQCFYEQRVLRAISRAPSDPLFHLQEGQMDVIRGQFPVDLEGEKLAPAMDVIEGAMAGDDKFDGQAILGRGMLPVALSGAYAAMKTLAWNTLCRAWAIRAVVQQDTERLETLLSQYAVV